MSDKFERFKRMFLDECSEHIRTLETALASLLAGGRSQDLIDDAFRAIHSIKGGAGMFGFDRIVPFAHVFESVLDGIRTGQITMSEALLGTALRSTDCLGDIIRATGNGAELAIGFEASAIEALESVAHLSAAAAAPALTPHKIDRPRSDMSVFTIGFRPHAGLLKRANEPLLIVNQLEALGNLQTTADISELPPFAEMNATDAYLSWIFNLETAHSEVEIRDAFQFVEGDCGLTIQRLERRKAAMQPLPSLDALAADQTASTLRVDTERIDRLVNLAGEIAISQALVAQLIDQSLCDANPGLFQELSQLLTHTQNLQDSVMAIRAQPIRAIFDRMPRLVRELSEQTKKKIRLRVAGEGTEIDKTVIEQLIDPIMHMIRNSADHGIESAAERIAAGKPQEGTIILSAEQRGSRIVIEISDDGRGIDRQKVKKKAVARGLVAEDAELSADDIDNLLFLPGFTTADTVTSISGRGVGMDVVKRNIQKLGGRVSLKSESGRGSTVVITLPLTLAVLEGMIVRSGHENYVLPITSIVECRAPWQKDAGLVPGFGEVLNVHGAYVTLIHLSQVFGQKALTDPQQSVAIIAEVEGGGQIALVVDEIVGQQQVVVKSITENLEAIPGIAGATILGNGRVALILDATEISMLNSSNARKHFKANFLEDPAARRVA